MARRRRRAQSNGHGHLPTYRSYVFKDKEPSIDKFRTLVEDHYGRRVNRRDLADIEHNGGPSVSCMAGWFFGDTMRPQNVTMEAAGRAMGYERVWRRMGRNR